MTDLRPSPFRMGAEEVAEKMSKIVERNVPSKNETLETLEAILPRKTSPRTDVIELIKEHLVRGMSGQAIPSQKRSRNNVKRSHS